jgi:glutamate racemase
MKKERQLMNKKDLSLSKKPIGIFDSGLGGLTVLSAVSKLLPKENLIYLGDTAHVPYGSKSKEVVTQFSLQIAKFLLTQNIKLLVVACNTASAFALSALRNKIPVPVIGVIYPGAKGAVEATISGRIGVIGTEGTIKSNSYASAIASLNPKLKVFSKACPLFVPLVEEGWSDNPVTKSVALQYLKTLINNNIDTLVLGCTHYPLLKKTIMSSAKRNIRLIDSAIETANEVKELLSKKQLLNTSKHSGKKVFYVTDAPEKFKILGTRFLGKSIPKITKVTLD